MSFIRLLSYSMTTDFLDNSFQCKDRNIDRCILLLFVDIVHHSHRDSEYKNFSFHIVCHSNPVDIHREKLKEWKSMKCVTHFQDNLHDPVGTHRALFWHCDRAQGLNGVVVVTRVSQQRPVNVEGHWQIKVDPWTWQIPPFRQGFGWHGVAATTTLIMMTMMIF